MEPQMEIKSIEKGKVIFKEGDYEKILYKILSGTVGIYSDYGGAEEIRLSLLEKNHCFGEMSILENCPRSATAIAEETVLLATYPEHLMITFIKQNPTFALEIMQNMSKRLRNSTKELEKIHKMLVPLSEQKISGKELQEYVRQHTIYAPNGTIQFNLEV